MGCENTVNLQNFLVNVGFFVIVVLSSYISKQEGHFLLVYCVGLECVLNAFLVHLLIFWRDLGEDRFGWSNQIADTNAYVKDS